MKTTINDNIIILLLLSCFSRVRLCVTPETAAPHPWGSPGKNTRVGCHSLLQCRKVRSESEVSCVGLLATPWTAAHPGFPVHHQLLELSQTHVH